jgi:hypothetical protein
MFSALLQVLQNHGIVDKKIIEDVLKIGETIMAEKLEVKGKKLAKKLYKRIPFIYVSRRFEEVATIWKNSLNETAKILAFANFFPELNHNEVVGFEEVNDDQIPNKKLIVLILRDPQDSHPRIITQMGITKSLIEKEGVEVEFIDMKGKNMLEKIFSTVLLGLWTSFWLAMEYKVDPTEIKMITEFKKLLGESRKIEVINEDGIPKKISFIIADVDNTVTEADLPHPETIDRLIKLAQKGVTTAFITGRNQHYVKRVLIEKIKERAKEQFPAIADKFIFRAEVGLIEINDAISGKAEVSSFTNNHPLLDPKVRNKIASLAYRTNSLAKWKQGDKIPNGFEVGADAENNLFLFPIKPPKEICFPDLLWDEFKDAMGGLEVRREKDGRITKERVDSILPMAKKVEKILQKWGYSNFAGVSPVGTSINLPMKIDGIFADKDWAAGKVLSYLSKKSKMPIEKVTEESMAIGDGLADFLLSTPRIKGKDLLIPFFFIGPATQWQPTEKQKDNTVIRSLFPYSGAKITSEVLDYLKNRF